jgi:hypothetical protein
MTALVRFIAPSTTSGKNPISAIGGRSYSVADYSVVDVGGADAALLSANGWLQIAQVGPTAGRPLPGSDATAASHGCRYVDTDLSKLIVFDGRRNVWIDPVTGAVV